MPDKTAKKNSPRSKGKGLTKKVGPFPLYVYLIGVGIVVLYFYVKHRQQTTSPSSQFNGSLDQQTIPSGIVVPSSTSSGNDNQGSNDGSVNYPTDYATETDLSNAIDAVNNSTAQAIAGITFPTPNVNITVPTSVPAKSTAAVKTAAKKAAIKAPIKYYTYKKNVPLKAGQTLHYTKGKGYYAG